MNKKAMYALSYGLFVLTAREQGKDNGCIINTAIQAASEPNQVSVSVNKANYTHDMILSTGEFTVSILSQEATFALFERFGFQSGRSVDKFEGFEGVKRGENGILYVTEGTNAFISVQVKKTVDLGSHTMFIGTVTDMEVLSTVPSATYGYYQEHIKKKPQPMGKTADGKTIWRCTVCGYEYVGEELPSDYICPLCKHPASDFEKVTVGSAAPAPVEEAVPAAVTKEGKTIWRCTICGYEYEGDTLPEGYTCPMCTVPAELFEKVVKEAPVEEAVPVAVTKEGKTIWRCTICGYEYEGDTLPEGYTCPMCTVPAELFEKVQ